MAKDLHDLERGWATGGAEFMTERRGRLRSLTGWWIFTIVLVLVWVGAWLGGGSALGAALQKMYGVEASTAPLWLRSDAHLHAVVTGLLTCWAAWGGRLFTPIGSWLGPPVAVVIAVIDEMLQLGQAGRSFEWGDQVAGAFGIVVVSLILIVRARMQRSR
jgi:hypothetical protein